MKTLSQRTPRLPVLILALVVVILAMFLAHKCTHANRSPFSSELPAKSGGDTLDVAIEISPLSYSLAGDTVSGLDYDLVRAYARSMHRPVKFHPFAPLQYALDGLARNRFDIVVSSLPSTRSLKDSLLLTDRVYLDREVLVQRADSVGFIASPEDLAGDSVWIAAGSPFEERLRNLSHEIGDTIFVKRDGALTAEHLVMLIAAGQIPRAVINEGVATRMAQSYPELDISTPVSFTQFQTWALAPGNTALQRSLNDWLRLFSQTPEYERLTEHYLLR